MLIRKINKPLWDKDDDSSGGGSGGDADDEEELDDEATEEEEYANEYEAQLAKEHPELLAAYRAHTGNLLSALSKEREAAKLGKDAKKQLKAYQDKEEEEARKTKTEVENLTTDVQKATTRAETAEAELARLKKERVVLDVAGALKFEHPDLAVKLVDMGSLAIGEDGKIDKKAVETTLKQLAKEYDLLEKKDLGPGNDDDDENKRHLDKDPSKKKKYKENQPKLSI